MNTIKCVLLIAASMFCALGQTVKYKASWANSPDCPLKILGAGFAVSGTRADVFGQVTLANASEKEVRSAQLAWSIEGGETSGLVFGFGPVMTLNLGPGDVAAAGGQGADAESTFKVLGASSPGGAVTLSVLVIRFTDGTEWRRELDPTRAFRDAESPKVYAPFQEKHRQLMLEMQTGGGPAKRGGVPQKCLTQAQLAALVAGPHPPRLSR